MILERTKDLGLIFSEIVVKISQKNTNVASFKELKFMKQCSYDHSYSLCVGSMLAADESDPAR